MQRPDQNYQSTALSSNANDIYRDTIMLDFTYTSRTLQLKVTDCTFLGVYSQWNKG